MGLVQQADPGPTDSAPGALELGLWGWCNRWILALLTGTSVSCLTHLVRNVEEVCRFPELPARKPLTYQAKQLIAREIEMEKMRRAEALACARGGPQVSSPPGAGTACTISGLALTSWLSSPFPSGEPGSADGQWG